MNTSDNRHPSRDALLRDSLGQLRELKGVTLDAFSFTLNALAHAMCPSKMLDQAALSSLTALDAGAVRVISAWRKRVERWSTGDTEFPAWLEEPWSLALEEYGDKNIRRALTYRHGMIGVELPKAENVNSCGFQSMGNIADGMGEVLSLFAQMMDDGVLDQNDKPIASELIPHIRKAVSVLVAGGMLVRREVLGETVQ
ncbi:hypothetical protein LMG33818_000915 [Halomonadaceae bacterium LMG 33818]|uniref:hypothetical protein n=1 Tax=Cernens ardua TaxID=3402176 RepID=UPI003EDC8255